ncbi:MAG TPA: histidine kinase [Gaiellaceae bacterium]
MSEMDEIRASRGRLTAAAFADRRRLERALHDGVQQDLIAISVRLQLLRALVVDDRVAALELLDELEREARGALDRARTLAAEIYPSLLDLRGLPDALREAARAVGVRALIDAPGLGRLSPELESAVYFGWCAALGGAGAGAPTAIVLRERDGTLEVEFVGGAFDATRARDLLEAVGGRATVEETSGGRRVAATIPLAQGASAR